MHFILCNNEERSLVTRGGWDIYIGDTFGSRDEAAYALSGAVTPDSTPDRRCRAWETTYQWCCDLSRLKEGHCELFLGEMQVLSLASCMTVPAGRPPPLKLRSEITFYGISDLHLDRDMLFSAIQHRNWGLGQKPDP